MFPKAQPFGGGTPAQANRLVPALNSHLGGTELLAPLQAVLAQPPAPVRLRKIILLTDGQVGNEAEILALAQQHRGEGAIYPVGLGRGPNAYFIRSLARLSGGLATLVHPRDRLEPVMVCLMAKIATPALHPVEVDWDGLTPELEAPRDLSPLHPGEHLLVLARFADRAPGKVIIRAEDHAWELMPATSGEDDVVPLLLAREALRELEDRLLACHWGSSSRKARELKGQILSLSRRYGLLSSLTSFLVVAERLGKKADEMALHRLPMALTLGWAVWLQSQFIPAEYNTSINMPISNASLFRRKFSVRLWKLGVLRDVMSVPYPTGRKRTSGASSRLSRLGDSGG